MLNACSASKKRLQFIEFQALLLPVLGGDQFTAPARQPGLDILGDGDDLLGQFGGFRPKLLDRFIVGVFVADQPFGQTQQFEESDQFRQRQALGLLDVLEGQKLIQRHLAGFVQIGGVELLASQAQGDVAVLHKRGEDDEEKFRLKLVLVSRSTSFFTVISSLRLTTWPGGLPSSFSTTTLA